MKPINNIDEIIRRTPFLKSMQILSAKDTFLRANSTSHTTINLGEKLIKCKSITTIEFRAGVYQNYDNYIYHFILAVNITLIPDEKNLESHVLSLAAKMMGNQLSFNKELVSKSPDLTPEQTTEIVHLLNKQFFELEEKLSDNPINESLSLKIQIINGLKFI